VNRTALEDDVQRGDAVLEIQQDNLECVYPPESQAQILQAIEINRGIVEFFREQSQLGGHLQDMVSLEFGIGRGYLLLAASQAFKRSYGTDLRPDIFEKTVEVVGKPGNVQVVTDCREIAEPVDVIFLWHVMEHLSSASNFLNYTKSFMPKGGYIFLQVPLYRPQYVVRSHYTFFNHRAITVMARSSGFVTEGIWHDVAHSFMTCLLRTTEGTLQLPK
jgi:hypothetical protein